MDFTALFQKCQLYLQGNKTVALAIIAAIAIFGYLKPKVFFKLLMLALFLGGVLYVVSLLGESATTGVQQTDQMLHKSQEILK